MFFDPGVMTGYAWLSPDDVMLSWQGNFADACEKARVMCEQHGPGLIVCWEKFDITPATYRMRGADAALEVIGAVRYIAMRNACQVLPPAPRAARKAIPRDALRNLGWHAPGKIHANDAAAHLLAWLIRNQQMMSQGIRDMIASSLERH